LAKVPPSLAIRLAHTGGLALGYALAAFVIPRTSGAVVFWGGAPLLPGGIVAGLAVAWLLVVWLVPPGPAGVEA
ncbi:MAG: hypothetical protein HUU35_10075, partial [Armatimonadetes bacterium]|nr:hypothetical protein [Armatimonadota bacterium]